MFDNEYSLPSLNFKVYEMIERKVYELYEELQIHKIPIQPFNIVKQKGYIAIPFSKLDNNLVKYYLSKEIDGTSFFDDEKKTFVIHYNDFAIKERQRFTIMHEIGHIVLGHKEESDLADKMANSFASYSLAPSPLIMKYNCEDYIDVAKIFDISSSCAYASFKRYLSWYYRDEKLKDYEQNIITLFIK